MRAAIKAWWHRRRYVDCGVCGREFRKGYGGGKSGEIFCSNRCWSISWFDYLGVPR